MRRNADMRRSASSVTSRPTPEPDVSEHFRRSLSGKWPRRQTNYVHYTPLLQTDADKKISGDDLVCTGTPYVIHSSTYFNIKKKKKKKLQVLHCLHWIYRNFQDRYYTVKIVKQPVYEILIHAAQAHHSKLLSIIPELKVRVEVFFSN